jgi:two-component system nitrate/nitrite sensor histidine kinase NarX
MNRVIWNRLQNSLLLRLGGMIVAITVLSIVGMSTSWMLAEATQGNGEAINIAGSLRMQSWRMALLQQQALQDNEAVDAEQNSLPQAIEKFESDLLAEPVLSVLPSDDSVPVRQVYREIEARWFEQIKPRLSHPATTDSGDLLIEISAFVSLINDFVKHIEESTEAKIFVLKVILGVAVLGTILIVILSVYLHNNILVKPLKDLLGSTDEIRRGNLAVRTGLTGEDEIGQLGQAFDLMAGELSLLYHDLEARVERKTAELTRSNRSLDLLYRSIIRLHGTPPGYEIFHKVLKDAEAILGLGNGTLCLKDDSVDKGQLIGTSKVINASSMCEKSANNCRDCQNATTKRLDTLPGGGQVLCFPLLDSDKRYGSLAIDIPPAVAVEAWQVQLLEALSHHISVAIAAEQRSEQHRRVALLEERAVIARELHDSLAQSLAYMRIQLSRLKSTLKDPDDPEDADEVMEELREGLNSSYHQLRELLSTFRLRIEGADLGVALAETTAEFADRGDLPIELDISIGSLILSPNEEIHLLQITREALSNIIKHAQATQAWVSLQLQADDTLQLLIEDNGIGIQKAAFTHHYGMAIMEERARALHGTLQYRSREGGGTCVQFNAKLHHNFSEIRISHVA